MSLSDFSKLKPIRIGLVIFGLGALLITGVIIEVRQSYRHLIYKPETVPAKPVIMVLGASLKPDGQPSDALMDRLKIGIALYNQQKGRTILVTGDDGRFRSNEIEVMKNHLTEAGVQPDDIWVDGQGYRTYESCIRAKKEFKINQAILVTQDFHISRALYLCNHLGVQSVGVTADLRDYNEIVWMTGRDWLASFKAWLDLNVWTPKPPV